MPESRPKRRWYHITPDRLIYGLLSVGGFLFLSEQFQWFAFNEKKGWTVLVAVLAVSFVVVVMLLWLLASLFSRLRFQFTVRSLVVLVVAVAIPCCWFGVKMRQAERQRKRVEAIRELGGRVDYDWEFRRLTDSPPHPWLMTLVGQDFLWYPASVEVAYAQFTDAELKEIEELTELRILILQSTQVTDESIKHLEGLTELKALNLIDTQVSDAGLQHLEGMQNLEILLLWRTQVTLKGINELRKALPHCEMEF